MQSPYNNAKREREICHQQLCSVTRSAREREANISLSTRNLIRDDLIFCAVLFYFSLSDSVRVKEELSILQLYGVNSHMYIY